MPQTHTKTLSVFVAILILLLGIFIGGFLILKTRTGSANIGDQINYLLGKDNSAESEKNDIDSDSDGLPDWQEKVYGANPNNPDTDGDGYFDGEEVASGYDPTKKAPNDELADVNPKTPRPLPKNLTKALSQKLSQAIVEGKIKSFDENGKLLSSEELQQDEGLDRTINDALGQQLNEFVLPNFPESDLKISSKNNKEEAIAYLTNMGNALEKISAPEDSELEVFAKAMEGGDFSKIEQYKKTYYESYLKLKDVSVPSDLISFHKGILGVLWVTSNIYEAVKNVNQDPLKTIIALNRYRDLDGKTDELTAQLFEKIKKYQ